MNCLRAKTFHGRFVMHHPHETDFDVLQVEAAQHWSIVLWRESECRMTDYNQFPDKWHCRAPENFACFLDVLLPDNRPRIT